MKTVVPTLTRFKRHVKRNSRGCWVWQSVIAKGYGRFKVEGRFVQAHVWSYRYYVGEIPEGLELDHLCRNRACVNPRHLEPVTHSENLRRSHVRCPKGHEYTGLNSRGHKICHPCMAASSRKLRLSR